MPPVKPYRSVPIRECGERLVAIPPDAFLFFAPHPYQAAGAPYHDASPWMLRQGILQSLSKAQTLLHTRKPGWRFKLMDAYRPNAVQAFMVARELTMLARQDGLDPAALTEAQHATLLAKVYRIWGMPSDDPATPPPHSTGAAFDLTLADDNGDEVAMGSPLDENSDRSYPDYFKDATDSEGRAAHANRGLLHDVLRLAGFWRNPTEWWHFSRGDQLAQWIEHGLTPPAVAIYGRADLLPLTAPQ